ncbi:hypothetical protein CC85DRAFT_284392, partial [Cutaneotrichosporon oleaginosum]
MDKSTRPLASVPAQGAASGRRLTVVLSAALAASLLLLSIYGDAVSAWLPSEGHVRSVALLIAAAGITLAVYMRSRPRARPRPGPGP